MGAQEEVQNIITPVVADETAWVERMCESMGMFGDHGSPKYCERNPPTTGATGPGTGESNVIT